MFVQNRDVKLEYKTLKEKMKEYNKKEAKFYGNMFARMNKLGALETNVSFNLLFSICTVCIVFGFCFCEVFSRTVFENT